MKIIVYSDSDHYKNGKEKPKNNILIFTEEEFKNYVKQNNLNLSKGYIDLIGYISNGLKFRAYYKGLVVGVTSIINEVEQ